MYSLLVYTLMSLDSHYLSHKTTTITKTRTVPLNAPQKALSGYPIVVKPPPPHIQPLAAPYLLCNPIILPFPGCHRNEVRVCSLLRRASFVQALHLRVIHAVRINSEFSLFLSSWPLDGCVTIHLSILQLDNVWVVSSFSLTIMNNAAINIHIQAFV